ncbi:hypothetical protein H2198_008350 [Neophaeococcomyces mojaviensis]|uniref:Uncharacterized protein n=1 Tax=Neophaeococcomyces mojaviensis TaxID=3383035 RepID=A0ACC2ZXT5_9EURO|nr:hypothetical protein H2198_008350 [Knufia sp. JES_112]
MSTDWSVRSRKRQPTSAIPAPRKRARLNDAMPTATRSAPQERLRHQQTLTQIDFVKSSSFEKADNNPTELEPLPTTNVRANWSTRRTPAQARSGSSRKRSIKKNPTLTHFESAKSGFLGKPDDGDLTKLEPLSDTNRPPRRVKKRDSTLTQMDFFSNRDEDDETFDDSMLEQDSGEMAMWLALPAFDGTHDTPAKPAPKTQAQSSRRRSDQVSIGRSHDMKEEKREERQQNQSRKRRKLDNSTAPDIANRRRSGRLAAASASKEVAPGLSVEERAANQSLVNKENASATRPVLEIADSTDFLEPSQGRLQPSTTHSPRGKTNIPAKKPVLEIQETVFFEPGPERSRQTPMYLPVTPSKPKDRIPSSQSPESIILSTQKSKRRPLAELSTNVQLSPSKPVKLSPMKSSVRKSPKRKVCVLKIPSKATLPRQARIEDSQHDVYSLQPTSSVDRSHNTINAEKIDKGSPSTPSPARTPGPAAREFDVDVAIEPSPTPKQTMDTQKSLPDIVELLGFSSPQSKKTVSMPSDPPKSLQEAPPQVVSGLASAEQRDHGTAVANNRVVCLDNEPVNMIPELGEVTTDELSDLGSPIPNETQFDRKLFERILSPTAPSQEETVRRRKEISPPMLMSSKTSIPATTLCKTPLPTPRLIHTSPTRSVGRPNSSRETASPINTTAVRTQSTQERPLSNVEIARVPLKDVVLSDKHQSSSPLLPPPPLPASFTQKSVHPASMPHPSQVSTQAPSQGYWMSSAPQSVLLPREAEVERITIKDSSSVPARLSQYQRHNTQDNDNDLVDLSDQEDDLDLDPASFRPPLHLTKHLTIDTEATTVIADESLTQTPTQKPQTRTSLLKRKSTTQSSPIILNATTRSQRDARLEVIALTSSSSSPLRPQRQLGQAAKPNKDTHTPTPRPQKRKRDITPTHSTSSKRSRTVSTIHLTPQKPAQVSAAHVPSPANRFLSSPTSSSIASTPSPRPLKRRYSPIPGFDNETQSDFTQGGHVTAAHVHRMREDGLLPPDFVPKPYKAKNWKVSSKKPRNRR